MEKYINPFTDYGFKRLFGEELNKDVLKDFLNELLKEEQGTITDLTYLKNENLGNTQLNRKAVFDLYCTNDKGERFIVELQKTKQKYFKERTLYYSTFPIQEQGRKGNEWNFKLEKVFIVCILDFEFSDNQDDDPEQYRHDVQLINKRTNKVFIDTLNFVYLEMPKFKKNITDLKTKSDKWLYVIKNLSRLSQVPKELQETIFLQLFKTAEISKFTIEEYRNYEDSLKYYRDLKNSLDIAREEGKKEGKKEGREEGLKEGKKEGLKEGKEEGLKEGLKEGKKEGLKEGLKKGKYTIARNLKKLGATLTYISDATGLTIEEIEKL